MTSLDIETVVNGAPVKFLNSYIGAPMTLGYYVSIVRRGGCGHVHRDQVFSWSGLNETLACGNRLSSPSSFNSCTIDNCRNNPGTPLSRGLACRKFRSCNHEMSSCDPFHSLNTRFESEHPYCACRKNAAADAERLKCPRIDDDGGECEIPRRDLAASMSKLPCLCFYKTLALYPYLELGKPENGAQRVNNSRVQWFSKEMVITAPAKSYTTCPC
ncbi:uncharacterized protein LOC131927743 [Physella acuta]|uniref:uncharacterized protein LOC131927743 n=1 Tax=Physella acuta TaxID=109671 RepID=UPI0027DC091F|nr:uncharacterized protein LOC131927743 [Physella acuta]